MQNLLTRLLRFLPPETAHHLVIRLLRVYQSLWDRIAPLRVTRPITNSVLGLPFRNRLGLGAGFDKNAEAFSGLSRMGFGFIEVGTVTPLPQPGNPRPRLFRLGRRSLVNRMGFNNCGLEKFRKNILRFRSRTPGLVLFANIGKGRNTPLENAIGDYEAGFRALEDCVDGFVVNVSSPNTASLVSLQNESFLKAIAGVAPAEKPVLIKLSPDLSDQEVTVLAQVIKSEKRIAGLVLTNTSRRLAEEKFPEGGGWSGPELFERSLHLVRLVRKTVGPDKVIIGGGGVSTRLDYQRMRAAGADLVEIYTVFVYRGPSVVAEMISSEE